MEIMAVVESIIVAGITNRNSFYVEVPILKSGETFSLWAFL